MKLDAKAWRVDIAGVYKYRIQINEIEDKNKKVIKNIFSDWTESGVGWNLRTKNEIAIFNKQFNSEEEWLNWASSCPIRLTEIKLRNGQEKYIQHSCKARKKRE